MSISKGVSGMGPNLCGSLDQGEAERGREPCRGALERVVELAPDLRLRGEAADLEGAANAVCLQVGAAGEAVADQERQDVVAVHPLVLALVHLDQMVEAEQTPEERP